MKLEFQSLGQMEEWGMGAPVWYLRDFVKDAAISKAMTELVTASAFPGRHKFLQRRPDDPARASRKRLEASGFVNFHGDDSWSLSETGLSTAEYGITCHCKKLSACQEIFPWPTRRNSRSSVT